MTCSIKRQKDREAWSYDSIAGGRQLVTSQSDRCFAQRTNPGYTAIGRLRGLATPDSAACTSGLVRLSVMLVTAPALSLGEIPNVGGMVCRT